MAERTESDSRKLLRRLRDSLAVPAPGQDRLDGIIEQLSALTKDKLLKMMGGMAEHRYKNDTKSRIVDQVYDDMLNDMNLSRSLSYSMGKGSYEWQATKT